MIRGTLLLAERAVTALETIAKQLVELNVFLERHSYQVNGNHAFNVTIEGDVGVEANTYKMD
jgi:hypothetical protein